VNRAPRAVQTWKHAFPVAKRFDTLCGSKVPRADLNDRLAATQPPATGAPPPHRNPPGQVKAHQGATSQPRILSTEHPHSRTFIIRSASSVKSPRPEQPTDHLQGRSRRHQLKYLYLVKFGAYPVRGYAYTCLINEFQLEPLYVRRQIASVLYLHRIVHCKIDCSELVEMLKFRIPKLGIRYSATFSNQLSSTNYHQNSPIIAMCTLYNQLQLFADIFEYHAGTFRRRISEALSLLN
jgi:hypothetical protein